MKKAITLILCLALCLASLTACGKANEPQAPQPEPQQPQSPADPQPEAPKDPVYKDEIILGISGKITVLDPQENTNTQHNYIFRCVFDTPLDYDNQTGQLKANICTDWTSDDAKTWSFTLRDDVFFHTGEKLTAQDVCYTYERGKASSSSAALCSSMESVESVDDTHFTVTLAEPNVDFPFQLTLPTSSILSRKALEEDPEKGALIGSGPWKIDSYIFGDYVKLAANDAFWGESPKAKILNFRYMPDNSARLIALETGEIDICQYPDNNELDHVRSSESLKLESYKSCSMQYLALNTASEVFKDVNTRLAICYAIDRDELIDVTYNGLATKCGSTWGWNSFGYNGGGITEYTYDPEKAKEYLAKAGYSDTNPLTFDIAASSGVNKTFAEIMQAQLNKLGIIVTVSEYDSAGLSTLTSSGGHDACMYGFGPNAFGSDIARLIDSNSGVNKAAYHSEQVHSLMLKAQAELDEAVRKDLYHQVQQILFEDAPYLPVCTGESFFAMKKGVGGIDYYPTAMHDFSNVFCEIE